MLKLGGGREPVIAPTGIGELHIPGSHLLLLSCIYSVYKSCRIAAVKTPARLMEDTNNSPTQDAMQVCVGLLFIEQVCTHVTGTSFCHTIVNLVQEGGSQTLREDRHNPDFDEAPQNTWINTAETQTDKRQVRSDQLKAE